MQFMQEPYVVAVACPNSAFAAKVIEHADKLRAESMEQMCDDLREHPEEFIEFAPDGTSAPATQPINAVPPHIANPNASSVPPDARSALPPSYSPATPQQTPAPMPPLAPAVPAPQAPAAPMPPLAPAVPAPQAPAAPMPPQMALPPQTPPPAQYAAALQSPNLPPPQAGQYSDPPINTPASAPVIQKEQLQTALQLFASSSQAHAVQVRDLLARFGVDAFDSLPPAKYPEFVNIIRGMGCAI